MTGDLATTASRRAGRAPPDPAGVHRPQRLPVLVLHARLPARDAELLAENRRRRPPTRCAISWPATSAAAAATSRSSTPCSTPQRGCEARGSRRERSTFGSPWLFAPVVAFGAAASRSSCECGATSRRTCACRAHRREPKQLRVRSSPRAAPRTVELPSFSHTMSVNRSRSLRSRQYGAGICRAHAQHLRSPGRDPAAGGPPELVSDRGRGKRGEPAAPGRRVAPRRRVAHTPRSQPGHQPVHESMYAVVSCSPGRQNTVARDQHRPLVFSEIPGGSSA